MSFFDHNQHRVGCRAIKCSKPCILSASLKLEKVKIICSKLLPSHLWMKRNSKLKFCLF